MRVAFSLDRDATPEADSVMLLSKCEGMAQASAAAKRAVLRCGNGKCTLPVEKYEQWRNIELTFTPERTILR
jgi:hypothetical protein